MIFPKYVSFLFQIPSTIGMGWGPIIPIWLNIMIVAGCTITDADRWATPGYEPVKLPGYFLFILFSPFYMQALLIISMISHCRHFFGMTKWVVTPR